MTREDHDRIRDRIDQLVEKFQQHDLQQTRSQVEFLSCNGPRTYAIDGLLDALERDLPVLIDAHIQLKAIREEMARIDFRYLY